MDTQRGVFHTYLGMSPAWLCPINVWHGYDDQLGTSVLDKFLLMPYKRTQPQIYPCSSQLTMSTSQSFTFHLKLYPKRYPPLVPFTYSAPEACLSTPRRKKEGNAASKVPPASPLLPKLHPSRFPP